MNFASWAKRPMTSLCHVHNEAMPLPFIPTRNSPLSYESQQPQYPLASKMPQCGSHIPSQESGDVGLFTGIGFADANGGNGIFDEELGSLETTFILWDKRSGIVNGSRSQRSVQSVWNEKYH